MMKKTDLTLSNGLPIDKAQRLTELMAETVSNMAYADVDGDGLEFNEILPITGNLIFRGASLLGGKGALKETLAQFADADYHERKELIATAAKKFDLRNPEQEAVIEDWLTHLNETTNLIGRTKKAFAA